MMIIVTLLLVILLTVLLFSFENRSNIPSILIIPILTALLTKYILGDWDKGYRYTYLDIVYWITLFGTSSLTVHILSNLSAT